MTGLLDLTDSHRGSELTAPGAARAAARSAAAAAARHPGTGTAASAVR
jgi:hypothetical protein